ncbi:hypothetical protein DFJ77DRAFT_463720 [Powellomyces hirtus]|nr:hypothetical protein DFJ77DRAFT_463720 [Powellomyces hirtus]
MRADLLIPGATFLLSLQRRHTVGALAALLSFGTVYLVARITAASFVIWISRILRLYLVLLLYIRIRAALKAPQWLNFPILETGNGRETSIVRCVDGREEKTRIRCADDLDVTFAVSFDQLKEHITRWIELNIQDPRIITFATRGESAFWHLEFTTAVWGFTDDIAIQCRQVPGGADVRLDWHSQSRWASDLGRNSTRLRALVEYLRDNL